MTTSEPQFQVKYGFRNKLTGQKYYHAEVQTRPPPWKYEFVERFDRDAQTVVLKSQFQQTPKDACTQVAATNIYLSSTADKIIYAKNDYVECDVKRKDFLEKIILVQKFARRWLARKELLRRKRLALLERLEYEKFIKAKIKQDKDWIRDIKRRLSNPKTDEDYRLLFSNLQKWWIEESKHIHESKTGQQLKEALYNLLKEETKKITDINEKKKLHEFEKGYDQKENILKKAGIPEIWTAYKKPIQVQTGNTQTAEYLHSLYLSLSMKYVHISDRIDVLKTMKEAIKPYQCKLTSELTRLADQEIDLHCRRMKRTNLEGLQNRIRDLFWQFAKKPVYNPRMEKLSCMGKIKTSCTILCCTACKCFYIKSIKALEKKGEDANSDKLKCKKCLDVENEAWKRKDTELYKRILNFIKAEEEKKTHSTIIHVLQPSDMKHLIEVIWQHQSCFSGSRIDSELEMVRYDRTKSWTPWNCLLVTRDEATALNDIDLKDYDENFKSNVAQKHAEAKRHFSLIPRFQPYLFLNLNHNKPIVISSDDEE